MRFGLIQIDLNKYRFAFTSHHILLDGWSHSILIKELFALYQSRSDEAILPRVAPYRDYLAWIATRDRSAAETAWRDALSGLEEPTLLARTRQISPATPQRIIVDLSHGLTDTLIRLTRGNGLTLNTVVQGAWSILLSRMTGRSDVVFGITVSGRHAELPDIEQMVGLLINTLPLRAVRWTRPSRSLRCSNGCRTSNLGWLNTITSD